MPSSPRPSPSSSGKPAGRTAEATRRVDDALRSYADRGVFRGFAVRTTTRGIREYGFRWLAEVTFRLRFDPRAGVLTFVDLLPNVPYPSPMDRAFRRYLRGRAAEDLPAHRRLDPARLTARAVHRRGNLSVRLEVRGDAFEYGARRAVSLVNEIFHDFLRGPYYAYTVENFNEPEE